MKASIGKRPPKVAMIPMNVRIPRKLKDRIDAVAREDRRTLGVVVQMALEHMLAERDQAEQV